MHTYHTSTYISAFSPSSFPCRQMKQNFACFGFAWVCGT